MPLVDANAQLQTITQYLRVLYGDGTAPSIAALRALMTAAFTAATQTVEINMSSGPLGTTGGLVKFDKTILLDAAMQVLKETDPTFPVTPARASFADFSRSYLET